MGKPSGLFPPPTELPFHLPHSSTTTPQTMHNCPSTVIPTTPCSLKVQRRAPWGNVTPRTGNPKWKTSHHQPAFLLERLSSRYTGGRDSDSLGVQPSPAFILQLGHLTREVPGHPGSSTYALKEANGLGFMDSSLTRPIRPLSSSQCAECAQWKSAESECGKFQPHFDKQSWDSSGFSTCPRSAQWHRILTSGYSELLPQTEHFPCPTCCHCLL